VNIWAPQQVFADSFQEGWISASKLLFENKNEIRNLVVHITDTSIINNDIHEAYDNFCASNNFIRPKHVAYTIFPFGLMKGRSAEKVFNTYNRKHGMYERVKNNWGTYFRRMTCYTGHNNKKINQLERIIKALKSRSSVYKAAYTIMIQHAGSENTRPLGGPCLNYIALQLAPGTPNHLGILAVYRNHHFVKRTYGNYWGLIKLQNFICEETGFAPGPFTCISSHAVIEGRISDFKALIRSF